MNCWTVECLPQRLPTAIFSALVGERHGLRMHERIEEHDVRLREQSRRTQREQVGGARTRTDEIDRSGHRTPTLAASVAKSAAALPPERALFAPWDGPAALV